MILMIMIMIMVMIIIIMVCVIPVSLYMCCACIHIYIYIYYIYISMFMWFKLLNPFLAGPKANPRRQASACEKAGGFWRQAAQQLQSLRRRMDSTMISLVHFAWMLGL